MKFTLHRAYRLDSIGVPAFAGYLDNDGDFYCLTLENVLLAIKAGTYPLHWGLMVSHGVHRAEITGVEGRSGLFIHSIENASQSLGCPGVGDSRGLGGTLHGGVAHGIAHKLADLVRDNPGSTIEILDVPEVPNVAMNIMADGGLEV